MLMARVESPQAALQRLIEEQREDYASLSRLIGRNAAYIQQFIKRGTPRRLCEEDRRTLAAYFGVKEAMLGGPDADEGKGSVISVPVIDVRASAGFGAVTHSETKRGAVGFDAKWLRQLARGPADGLSIICVTGDSMFPTLADGDDVIVDRNDGASGIRDGIYVLRLDDGLMIKRVARQPAGGGISVRSDNPEYPSWQNCRLDRIDIVGRVLWYGRKLA